MSLVLKNIYKLYKLCDDWSDPRVRDFLLMESPFPALLILAGYLYFVLSYGPKFMEKRKPYNINTIVKYYNLVQVALCLYVSVEAFRFSYAKGYNVLCQPVDYSNRYEAVKIAKVGHYYFLIKVIDLLDTIFFVLRKKQSQVSFLHVYHHTGMVVLTWAGVKYFPGGHSIFMGWINSIVHVIMYYYYYLTSVDSKYKESSFKKYITQMQLVQFGLIALQWFSLIVHPFCGFPQWPAFILLPQNAFICVLFYDFYRKAYGSKSKSSKQNGGMANGHSSKHFNLDYGKTIS